MNHIRQRVALLACPAVIATGFAPRRAAFAAVPTLQEAHDLAAEAYIFLYPLVSMDLTRRIMTNLPASRRAGFGPINAFHHLRSFSVTSGRHAGEAEFDTLHSSAWLDLTGGPVIVSLPDTLGRYHLLTLLDMWGEAFAAPGWRTTGTAAIDFAVLPPGWLGDLPGGLRRIDAPTPHVRAQARFRCDGPHEWATVHRLQDGLRVVPLTHWPVPAEPPVQSEDPALDMNMPVAVQVETLRLSQFLQHAAEAFQVNPPHLTDWSQVARLGRIGFVRGQPFDLAALPGDLRVAVELGAAEGARSIQTEPRWIGRNGWESNIGAAGVYGDAYLQRAVMARRGPGAAQPDDEARFVNVVDADHRNVVCDCRYLLHFERGTLPPADAFWSLTIADGEGRAVPNLLDRATIGSRDALAFNDDGSLDLLVQHHDPGEANRTNWLPGPGSGRLHLTLRLYAPRRTVIEGRWGPPPVRRLSSRAGPRARGTAFGPGALRRRTCACPEDTQVAGSGAPAARIRAAIGNRRAS
jgi:hypothetical protein